MKKGLRKSISSIVAAIMLSGSFIFAPIDIPEIGLNEFRFRDPAAPQILTYDESTGKYSIDGVESNISNVPLSGDYKLESNVPIKETGITISSGSVSFDLNGYDLVDDSGSNKTLIALKGSAVFTLSDSSANPEDPTTGGHLLGGKSATRRAFNLSENSTLNITGGIVYGFKTSETGAGVNMADKNAKPTFNFTGGMIDSCETSHGTGGGGVLVHGGTFTMGGYARISNCKTTGTGNDKSGNGAGINLGHNGIMKLTGHAKIIDNKGVGYHGAGIDFWGPKYTCTLEISGSPVVKNNKCGRDYENNLYCGKPFTLGNLETNGATEQIGISIQQTPVFTMGAKENNEETIEELAAYFFADKLHATHIPHNDTYKIEPSDDGQELKQTPTVKVSFCVPNFSDSENPWVVYGTADCVPGGYVSGSILDANKKNYNNHSIMGWNTQPGKFTSNFIEGTDGQYEDYNLYEVVVPKISGYTLCSYDDGSMGLNAYVSYNEDVGFVDSSTYIKLGGFTSNPNESDTAYVDMSNIVGTGDNQFVIATFKFNPYDMTLQITEKLTFSNGCVVDTGVQPSNIGKAIVTGSKVYGGNTYTTEAAKQLASSMLIFGSNLQTQLGYYFNSSNDLATKGCGGKLKTHENISSVSNVPEKSIDVGDTALTFYGTSVVYNTNIQIKHYIKLNGESAGDYTYSIDGEGEYELLLDNSGKYMYAKVNVPAYNMDHSYAVTIKDGSGTVVMTINYSIYNYIDNIITNKQGTAVYDTVQSLYWYGEDAKAYMGA